MRWLRIVAVLLALQAVLVVAWLGIEQSRRQEAPFRWETLDAPAPPLAVDAPAQPHLVHFWATWCAPCRTELPALMVAAEAEDVPLLAITDEPWPVVQRYFGGEVPASIVSADALDAWEVSGLPDTFVVREGRLVARMGGPRDWSTREARDFLRGLGR